MNFVSFGFAFLIVPVFLCRLLIGRNKTEPLFVASMIAATTIFCAWHIPAYILIMLTSIVIDYWVSIWIGRTPAGSSARKWLLAISVVSNLGLLGFFKYSNFLIGIAAEMAHALHAPAPIGKLDIVLPMGISFYTFCSMSYTIDVYRGKLKPVKSFADLYFFLTFFPHLVAGPIVRAEQFLYQIPRERHLTLRVFNESIRLIIRGFFLKMVCADNLAVIVNRRWNYGCQHLLGGNELLVLAFFFSFQIFCDFEGYTSIARGLAYLFGYRLPENFNNPYLAASFSEFWKRWHISLSEWLRDYLYIPLGGNRCSMARNYFNLITVMVVGGLWHGANLTFIVWGGIHGAALAIERGLSRAIRVPRSDGVKFLTFLIVQSVVLIGWIFFRSDTVSDAIAFLADIYKRFHLEWPVQETRFLPCLIPPVAKHGYGWLRARQYISPIGAFTQALLTGILLLMTLTFYGQSNEFIYFQF